MGRNKRAQIRYNALDKCFSNQYKRFFIKDLITHCEKALSEHLGEITTISREQIYADIRFMKSETGFNAPIESYRAGRDVYRRYSDTEFSITKSPLTPLEVTKLQELLENFARMNNLAGFEWITSLQAKLKSQVDSGLANTQIISFEENQYLTGKSFISSLYQSIINKQALRIHYKSYSVPKAEFVISPYYLKEYNNRWFLFGWNHDDNYIQNLALDRMQEIDSTGEMYVDNQTDFTEYFEDIIGVSNDLKAKVEDVAIRLSDSIIPYIKSKPLHGSQIIKDNILHLKVKLNYELEAVILSYGENMRVLTPPELVFKVKERSNKVNSSYQE